MEKKPSYPRRGRDGASRPYHTSDPTFRKPFGGNDNRDHAPRRDDVRDVTDSGAIVGRSAVRELLKSGRTVDKIFVLRGEREGSITVLVAQAIERRIPVIEADRAKLDSLSGGVNHQGIAALASEKEYVSVDDILAYAEEKGEKPLLLLADGIEDPYNLGAIIRCAEGAGAHGVIIPKRRSASLTAAVAKASAGAIEHIRIARVTGLPAVIDDLKKRGVWVFCAEAGGQPYTELDFTVPAAIVMGSEGDGVSRLVRDKSDFVASLPMNGQVNSLNVSTAAAVLLYEAVRQRGLTLQ